MILCTVYDSKTMAYLPPITLKTKAEAIRSFQAACKDENSNFSKWPEDYTMFQIAEWDEEKGVVTNLDSPIVLANASEFKVS